MAPWDILEWLNKPAGAIAGGYIGLNKMLSKDADPNNVYGDVNNPLEGLLKGFSRNYNAAQATKDLLGNTDEDSGFTELASMGMNIGADPLTYAGPLGKLGKAGSLGTGLASALEKAPTVGKALEGAGKVGGTFSKGVPTATRAGQFGRRYATGMAATGDPMAALGVAGLMGPAEWLLSQGSKSKAISNVLAKTGKAADVVEGGEDVAKTGLLSKLRGKPKVPEGATQVTDRSRILGRKLDVDAGTPAEQFGEALGKSVKEGTPSHFDAEIAKNVVPETTPESETAGVAKLKGLLEPKIGEAAKPPVRGPLIGEPEPDMEALATLKQTVAKAKATKAMEPKTVATTSGVSKGHTTGATPSPKKIVPGSVRSKKAKGPTTPGIDPGHITGPTPSPPLPPQATQLQMNLPTSGPIATSVVPKTTPPSVAQKPAIPPFLKSAPKPFEEILGTQPQLGRAANSNVVNLQSNPAIMQVLSDPSLTEDKKLEMILRGLGAIA